VEGGKAEILPRVACGSRRTAYRPLAPPGTYTVKLTVDGKESTQSLKVIRDPHPNGSEGDIQLQTRLMTSLNTQMDGVVDAVNQTELLQAELADLKSVLGSGPNAAPVLKSAEQISATCWKSSNTSSGRG